ncbi:hypothetical protein EB796_003132 [Bugula neritina]|uniref:Uncharacterized protein n=1 Tax=Bugula neritina TaxID=10212 RepID=A0A7J7KLB4_BUGNE|nr:hypothetical protein EB796_003132 [Bugula neritina]
MESANCSTGETKFKADMCDENEMHDSGCEQSPTTQSPAYKCDHADSVGTSKCLTYNREFLLSLQFSTLSLNPDPQSLLWPDDIQYMTNNIFNANHSYYTPDEVTSRVERKEMMPDYFKPMLEGNESVLRPQRNSFQSGCKVRTTNAAETNEKSGGPVKGPGSHRRVSESKDRPRSVPNVDKEEVRVERRVGSGRIALERGSSKTDTRSQYIPDSRGSYPGREKPSKPASNAERTNNWRSRPEEEREVHHGREGGSNRLRTGRDGREHRGSTYYHQSHHDQILPKSATGDLVLPETGFSFDAWLSLPGLNEAGENTVKSVGSSRASRWFKTEDSCPPLTVSNVENSYNPLSYSPELANDVGVSDDHMTQLVQGILSVGGPSVSPVASN